MQVLRNIFACNDVFDLAATKALPPKCPSIQNFWPDCSCFVFVVEYKMLVTCLLVFLCTFSNYFIVTKFSEFFLFLFVLIFFYFRWFIFFSNFPRWIFFVCFKMIFSLSFIQSSKYFNFLSHNGKRTSFFFLVSQKTGTVNSIPGVL